MGTSIVTSSINPLENLKTLNETQTDDLRILVIDEGDKSIRKKNKRLLSDLPHEFYGPKERRAWFNDRLGQNSSKYVDLIPRKCHAETSFGFLRAYEEGAEIVLEIDDDVFFSENIIDEHKSNLLGNRGVIVSSQDRWFNTIGNLSLNADCTIFPRGHPFTADCRSQIYTWKKVGGRCVLNMGLWSGQPDLDAITILYFGGLDGRCWIESRKLRKEKIIPAEGTYFAICSMNTSFVQKIIPAFYQLYMNFMGVDRFDDIWSGVYIKRIADHIGDKICLGKPLGIHRKRERNSFTDLKREANGLGINECLWKICEGAELSSKNYADCYVELAEHIKDASKKWFRDKTTREFLRIQSGKMIMWVDLLDKIS